MPEYKESTPSFRYPKNEKSGLTAAYRQVITRCLVKKDFDLLNTFLAAHSKTDNVRGKIKDEISELFRKSTYISEIVDLWRKDANIDIKKAFFVLKLLISLDYPYLPIEPKDLKQIYDWELNQIRSKNFKRKTRHF